MRRSRNPGRKARVLSGILQHFNATVPVGTPVAVCLIKPGPEYSTATRSRAWALGDGSPVVLIEGRTGGYHLSHVRPLGAAEELPPLPPKMASLPLEEPVG